MWAYLSWYLREDLLVEGELAVALGKTWYLDHFYDVGAACSKVFPYARAPNLLGKLEEVGLGIFEG